MYAVHLNYSVSPQIDLNVDCCRTTNNLIRLSKAKPHGNVSWEG